ncbi:helix-turn-helix domain-containing protein [Bacteroides acidifaciens]|uniref:helix-turn-helix domain-containing protein n=1 Tax=Bacteroides acidifaciens TaxID=85831 RepID=UPI00336C12DD
MVFIRYINYSYMEKIRIRLIISQNTRFLSVAEKKSISKAAASLYISQPAVSITIKKLEENLTRHFLSEDQRE